MPDALLVACPLPLRKPRRKICPIRSYANVEKLRNTVAPMSVRVLTAIPVFNEAASVAEVLAQVKSYATDVLVIDDGSTDETPAVLAEVGRISVLTHSENQGYGAALRSAFEYSISHEYDVVVTIDCDGQHQPSLIPQIAALVFPENDEPVDVVSGSRYLKAFSGDSVPPADRRQINVQITELVNQKLNLRLTDSFCGFKAHRVSSLTKLDITELGYAMPLQFWVQVVKAGLRVQEFAVPLIYLDDDRSFGGSLDDSQLRLAYYLDVLEREMSEFPRK
jgi:glycosyltransferase involved in cell wall biosynthesis